VSHIKENMLESISNFKTDQGRAVLHRVINALDDLRRHSDLPEDKLDDFYIDIEEINGVAIYQNRSLNNQEIDKIGGILKQLSVLLSSS